LALGIKEFWIQIENNPWDTSPNNINRITGESIESLNLRPPVLKTLTSPVTLITRKVTMYNPLNEDALILRRYTKNWEHPDDRKVNPWDINEKNPSDNGTMGTIPGAVIECNVGDTVVVHFRNMDKRSNHDTKSRTHSLHPHGFVFNSKYDGAYPLSPADPSQPVGPESTLWNSVGVTNFKRGDRIPPEATFTYIWETFGWPTTAGIWLYHDHSICDMENTQLGAIGIIVIHNIVDPDDVLEQNLPNNSWIDSPITKQPVYRDPPKKALYLSVYRDPPKKALYLQLYHNLKGVGMLVNGRKYMGNTPTLVAGNDTKMKFGVVGMADGFHTFHIHGHRWIIPGPDGRDPFTIHSSPQITAVSQFEDTRTFGPANSFGFTIYQGSFMGSRFNLDINRASGLGEWYMHCHVLNHMMEGMTGSLLIIEGGAFANKLPTGEKCPMPIHDGNHGEIHVVSVKNNLFDPTYLTINTGEKVEWNWHVATDHTTTSDNGHWDSGILSGLGTKFEHIFNSPGVYPYHCTLHGGLGGIGMSGTIEVVHQHPH
jgi:plastocyanin